MLLIKLIEFYKRSYKKSYYELMKKKLVYSKKLQENQKNKKYEKKNIMFV